MGLARFVTINPPLPLSMSNRSPYHPIFNCHRAIIADTVLARGCSTQRPTKIRRGSVKKPKRSADNHDSVPHVIRSGVTCRQGHSLTVRDFALVIAVVSDKDNPQRAN
ncbi:hypothetical protein J6590_002963 [Homalodisca vitripennis]|nr:hypothetical protein J6590_002963 [Homalodisca vitripennis]